MDTIVIEQADGTLTSSPFHVRFGKLKILKYAQKEVSLFVNGADTGLKMRLDKSGEAYFLQSIDPDNKEETKELDSFKEQAELQGTLNTLKHNLNFYFQSQDSDEE